MTAILTRRQFAAREHQRLATAYPDVTRAEIVDAYPADGSTIGQRWWTYLEGEVEAGHLPSTRLWRSLTDREQYALLRTHRALADDEFTGQLIAMSHVHLAGADHRGPATAIPAQVTCPTCRAA